MLPLLLTHFIRVEAVAFELLRRFEETSSHLISTGANEDRDVKGHIKQRCRQNVGTVTVCHFHTQSRRDAAAGYIEVLNSINQVKLENSSP